MKNYGVILGERPTDYRADLIAGALPFEERRLGGDWEAVLPSEEKQFNDNGDSMSCVSFAEISGIETQEKNMTGIEPNYSDRWIAKMSDTQREGNYLWKVADAIRKYGLVKEESYPAPLKYTWDQYHAPIPEPLLSKLEAEGQEWLKKWDVKYESVALDRASMLKHIKMAPLTVVIPGHAILNFRTVNDVYYFFDTYPPHKKTTTSLQAAMKVVLYPKAQAVPDTHLLVDVKYLDSGKQVEKLVYALKASGWDECEGSVYDQKLADYVLRYQKANLSRLSWNFWWHVYYHKGRLVDEETRQALNNLLK